ncbi:hypothetical protein T11_6709 [Trichinella zimbabwensis]|uniref:Uncharacterized protein n=1 Tax=Trichinella zimbabwensis TaxID=268475 RepID=A0A0V1H2H4_9BILA|nr:hypothetical protein T11_6709 [Trichinella zimbabwensis]
MLCSSVRCFAIFQRVNKWQYSTLLLEQHTAELSVVYLHLFVQLKNLSTDRGPTFCSQILPLWHIFMHISLTGRQSVSLCQPTLKKMIFCIHFLYALHYAYVKRIKNVHLTFTPLQLIFSVFFIFFISKLSGLNQVNQNSRSYWHKTLMIL